MQVEIQQLREDNRRLFEMMKHTKEFKEFAGFVEDSGGAVRGLKNENQAQGGQAIRIEESNQGD